MAQGAYPNPMSEQQMIFKNFISGDFAKMRKDLEKEQEMHEINQLFDNYLHVLGEDQSNKANLFVSTFYNKFPENFPKEQIDFYKTYIPKMMQVEKPVHSVMQAQQLQL